jgi:hypothetical protein
MEKEAFLSKFGYNTPEAFWNIYFEMVKLILRRRASNATKSKLLGVVPSKSRF